MCSSERNFNAEISNLVTVVFSDQVILICESSDFCKEACGSTDGNAAHFYPRYRYHLFFHRGGGWVYFFDNGPNFFEIKIKSFWS